MDEVPTRVAQPPASISTVVVPPPSTTSGWCHDPTPAPAVTIGATDPVTKILVPDDSVSATDPYALSIPKDTAATPSPQKQPRRPVDRAHRKAKRKAAKKARRRNR